MEDVSENVRSSSPGGEGKRILLLEEELMVELIPPVQWLLLVPPNVCAESDSWQPSGKSVFSE